MKREDSGTKTEMSHWECFSLVVRRGLADSISKKPQVAGLLFLHVVADRAFFVGYLGFRARIRLSACTKRSRKTFASYVPNLGKGMLRQSHLQGSSPLSLLLRYLDRDCVGGVKTRWGWVANRITAPGISKLISGHSSLWGLLP